MRTAIITTSYPSEEGDPSGHFVESEARALASRGEHVTVFGPLRGHGRRFDPLGIEVVSLPGGAAFGWPGFAARLRAQPWRIFSAIQFIASAKRTFRRTTFDRIVAHWALPCALPIATSCDVPLEIVSHGGDIRALIRLPGPLRERIVMRLVRHASQWRFVSERLREDLLDSLSEDVRMALLESSVIVPAYFQMPEVSKRVAIHGPNREGSTLFLCVGRLVPSKNFQRAIDFVADVTRSETGKKVELVVVGDGPERTRLERHARRRGVSAQFTGLVRRVDALDWIASADCLLHASRAEGLSTVLREAEALGTRVEILGE